MRTTAQVAPFADATGERRPTATRSLRRLVALIGAVLAGLTLIPMNPLAATAHAESRAAAAPPESGKLAPIMLVLDASGSMAASAPGGTKMTAAKRAVRTVVNSIPAESQLGLTVYGTGTGSTAGEKAKGCKDIKVVHPVGTLDKAAIVKAANAAKPRGYTPIGESLRTAAGALPKEGPRSIVLVSDGEDTCAPPEPCDVAKELAKQGVDLRIHTVGYQVDAKAKRQLTCIAKNTGGTYTNVPDASDLGRALDRVTATALRNYEAAGIPVTGTPTLQGAPALKPGGYLDTLDNAKRYYSVDIPAGNTAYFAATVPFERGGSVQVKGLNISVYGLNGTDCLTSENEVTTSGRDGRPLSVELTWDGLATKNTPYPECKNPGRYTFVVYYTGAVDQPQGGGGEELPLELLVGLEPPVTADKGPEPAGKPVTFQNPSGPDQPVTGGASFGTATALPGSGHFTEQVRYGEFLFYKVRLDWGQALSYRVRYPDDPGNRLAVNIESEMYAPSRRAIAWDTDFYNGSAKMLDSPSLSSVKTGGFSTLPIRYRNRELSDGDLAPHSVAGWYYFAIKLGRHTNEGSDPKALTVTMDVAVVGSAEKGPQYANVAGKPDSFGAAPASPSGATPLNGRKVSSESGIPWWIFAAIAAVAVIISGLLGMRFARRRRTASPQTQGPGTAQHFTGNDTQSFNAGPYVPGPGNPPHAQGPGAPQHYQGPGPQNPGPQSYGPQNPGPQSYGPQNPGPAPRHNPGQGPGPGMPPHHQGPAGPPQNPAPGTPPRDPEPDTPFGPPR